ncbi:MAG: transcriptional regulator [Nitrososphaerota archaeon]
MRDLFELVARYLVPSVRRHLARELVKMGMMEAEAARKLGLSRSAITRYIRSERGAGMKLARFSDVTRMIEDLAAKIFMGELDEDKIHEKIIEITSYILSMKYFCTYHKKLDPRIDASRCNVCPTIFAKQVASSI